MRYRSFVFDSLRWDGFEFRDDDIVISTPPKCGTTWTQNLVAMLVLGTTEFERPMVEMSPWIEQTTEPIEDVVERLEAQAHRRFIKSHTPLDGIPWHDGVRYVAVGRDPRDAAMSWDRHLANTDMDRFVERRAGAVGLDDLAELPPLRPPIEDPIDRFWDWVEFRMEPEFAHSLQGLVAHLRSFWEARQRDNVLLLHYADLLADLPGQIRLLADFLDVDVDDERVQEYAAAASFDAMKSRASDLAPNAGQFWKEDVAFFHAGGAGRWRELAGADEDDVRYWRSVRSLTDDDDFLAWLHRP